MFARPSRMKDFLYTLSALFLCLAFLTSCKNTTASLGGEEPFFKFVVEKPTLDFGNSKNFSFDVIESTTDGNNNLLVQYVKRDAATGKNLGRFVKLSNDGGKTFENEHRVTDLLKTERKFSSYTFKFSKEGFFLTAQHNGNLFFSKSDSGLKNWSKLSQINDEEGSHYGGEQLLSLENGKLFSIWLDTRHGFSQVFVSSSPDGGETWTPNQALEYDFREGKQERAVLLLGENGRLLVFWQDWRDPRTLVDIRYSYSDDNGKSWASSKKINDDEQEVWQMFPTVVSNGSNIFVAFADFRDKGGEEDNNWNVYFASSIDNGSSWSKNRRLNDAPEGRDFNPSLSIDKEGTLYCTWWTTRKTLFGQIAFSYSKDKGESWSPSVLLTPKNEMKDEGYLSVKFLSKDKLIATWSDREDGVRRGVVSFIQKSTESIVSESEAEEVEKAKPLKLEAGEVLFSDDFSDKSGEKWKPEEGLWSVVDGTYMGSKPNSWTERFVSYARISEPDSYVIKGRFKLDETAHMTASLYFRVGEKALRHYVIKNQFRRGTWLSIKDNDLSAKDDPIGGLPLVQKRYSFRQNRWYEFRLVVTPVQVDYYVNGNLMLSYDEKLILKKGRIGIGGDSKAPTYFDDISIAELKE